VTAFLYVVYTYINSGFLRADTSKLRISFTNCYYWMMLFTNSSPSCLTFSSAKTEANRFLTLSNLRDTNCR
jgi:hypothetical protein